MVCLYLSPFSYYHNNLTGESFWTKDGDTPGEYSHHQEGEGEEEDGEQGSLATARSRLRSAIRTTVDGDSSLEYLIHDTRGDWVEACDSDGSVLGASFAGRTVYYNRTTDETRLTKPPGWVRMLAQALTWSTIYDEESGHWYRHNAMTGETVWVLEEVGGGEEKGGEILREERPNSVTL